MHSFLPQKERTQNGKQNIFCIVLMQVEVFRHAFPRLSALDFHFVLHISDVLWQLAHKTHTLCYNGEINGMLSLFLFKPFISIHSFIHSSKRWHCVINTHLGMHRYFYIVHRAILESKYTMYQNAHVAITSHIISVSHTCIGTIITGWYYSIDSYIIDSMVYIETILNVMKYSKHMGIVTSNRNCFHSNNNSRISYPHSERNNIIL